MMNCSHCDFVVPEDSQHPVNSLRTHERHAHEGFPEAAIRPTDLRRQRCEREFLALVDALGSFSNAMEMQGKVIGWPSAPDRLALKALAEEWEDRVEAGDAQPNDRLVARMKQKVQAHREFRVWKMVESYADAGVELSQKAKDGDLDAAKQVTVKYFADGAGIVLDKISPAFGTHKLQTAQVNQLFINAGPPPPKKIKAGQKADIIEAEVREIVGHSNSADV